MIYQVTSWSFCSYKEWTILIVLHILQMSSQSKQQMYSLCTSWGKNFGNSTCHIVVFFVNYFCVIITDCKSSALCCAGNILTIKCLLSDQSKQNWQMKGCQMVFHKPWASQYCLIDNFSFLIAMFISHSWFFSLSHPGVLIFGKVKKSSKSQFIHLCVSHILNTSSKSLSENLKGQIFCLTFSKEILVSPSHAVSHLNHSPSLDVLFVLLFYQPYDEEFLKNHKPPIKHMSFHAFLKKLGGGTDRWVIMQQIVLKEFCMRKRDTCRTLHI